MAKKILVVCRQFWPEDSRLTELCEKLISLGMKIDVLCGKPSKEDGKLFAGYGSFKVRREMHNKINIYRSMDVKRGEKSNLGLFLNYCFFPLASLFLVKKLSANKYDAVFVYQISPVFGGIAGFKVAKKLKVPVYLDVVDLWPSCVYRELDIQSTLFKKLLSFISESTYKKAERIIVQSEKMRKYFTEVLLRPKSDLPIVTLSPDESFQADIPDNSLLEKMAGSFNCVSFGDFDGWLSAKTMVQIAEKLKKDGIRNIRFIIIGTGEEINMLKKLVHGKQLHDLFFFEGYVPQENYGRYLHLTDVLLAVLRVGNINEFSIPRQIINYMSAGKALLLSMNGVTREVVRKEKIGCISEAEDVDALYNNLKKLYLMPENERLEMGRRARSFQQENFNSDINAEKIFEILSGNYNCDDESEQTDIRKLWNLDIS